MLEQVDHRRAVQPHVVARRPDALRAGLADVEAQLEAPRLLQALLWQALQHVEAAEVDKEKLLLEGEVFLQMPVAAKGVEWVGDQRLVLGETDRLHLAGLQRQERQRQALGVGEWLALGIQCDQLNTIEMAQQAEVEHLADVALAGQVQPQPAHVDLARWPSAVMPRRRLSKAPSPLTE